MNRLRWLLTGAGMILLLSASSVAQISADEAIGLIDDLPVSKLDPALPQTPFLTWLKDLLGQSVKIEWELNDCGTQTGFPLIDEERDLSVCMQASVILSEQQNLGIAIFVGTQRKGLTRSPRVANIYIETNGDVIYFRYLSDLQAALVPPKTK